MNAARLGRLLDEAGGDPHRMAEAIADEVTDPTTGLVTKDHLDARLAELKTWLLQTLLTTLAAFVVVLLGGVFAMLRML